MSTTLYKSLSVRAVYFAALFLLCFGAGNGLASQNVYAMSLLYRPRVGSSYVDGYTLYYYFASGSSPSPYVAWPFLQDLQVSYTPANGRYIYYPYGYSEPGYANSTPYYYQRFSTWFTAGTIPDDWTNDDVDDLLNKPFNDLTPAQKAATTGTFIAGVSTHGNVTQKFVSFNRKTVGTATNGGVVTYNQDGDTIVSYPDNTGYASGYKVQPDGSYTPVYYTVDNGTVTEYSDITSPSFDSLSYDSDMGRYNLDIPDYSKHLDKIINKLDTLTFDNITLQVPTPEVTVNPVVTVTPEVVVNPTVTAPDVTVNFDTPDLSDIEESLVNIGNTLAADDHNLILSTNDLTLTSEEQSSINALRQWEIDIPLLGGAVDFGLNTLIGKIPNIGTEYVWMDYTLGGGSTRNLRASSSNNYLDGYRIRIDLTQYRDNLLAIRGWLILLEALYFILLIYRNVREALKV